MLERLERLDTCAVSDALDHLGLRGATTGIRPLWACPKIVGRAGTVKVVPVTARGRIQQDAFNVLIQVAGVQVRPGDLVIADGSGVVFIPQERAEEVIAAAERLAARQAAMVQAVRSGRSVVEVMQDTAFEAALKG